MGITAKPQRTNSTTAATQTILAAPGAGDQSRVGKGMINICNKGTVDHPITIEVYDGTNVFRQWKFTLEVDVSWTNPAEIILSGATDIIRVVTTLTEPTDFTVNYIEDE